VKHSEWLYPTRHLLTRKNQQRVTIHQGLSDISEFGIQGGGILNGRRKGNFHNRFHTTKVLGNSNQANGKIAFQKQRRSSNAFRTGRDTRISTQMLLYACGMTLILHTCPASYSTPTASSQTLQIAVCLSRNNWHGANDIPTRSVSFQYRFCFPLAAIA
jgi:hypothetical protein